MTTEQIQRLNADANIENLNVAIIGPDPMVDISQVEVAAESSVYE